MRGSVVGVVRDASLRGYDVPAPFDPPCLFPELRALPFAVSERPGNRIYALVRELFLALGLDSVNAGTERWNPLASLVKPGDQVLIKPNLVKHFHNSAYAGEEIDGGVASQVTQAAVLRPLLDYVLLASGGQGRVIVADTPLDKADFSRVLEAAGVAPLCAFYRDRAGISIETWDCRDYTRKRSREGRFLLEETPLEGPPGGWALVDLAQQSEFRELDGRRNCYYTLADFSVDRYDPRGRATSATMQFHSNGRHVYKIPRIFLESDVLISVPKLKTHKKAGVTLSLKNMVGICNKVYMPHYRPGAPPEGDAYPIEPTRGDVLRRRLAMGGALWRKRLWPRAVNWLLWRLTRLTRRVLPEESGVEEWWGDWHGNDTLWRTILDLNKIALYADAEGRLCRERQRRSFSLVDGIVGQEGEGPMSGDPKPCGVVAGGVDPASVDAVLADLMGFRSPEIPQIRGAGRLESHGLGDTDLARIELRSNAAEPGDLALDFVPSRGYRALAKASGTAHDE